MGFQLPTPTGWPPDFKKPSTGYLVLKAHKKFTAPNFSPVEKTEVAPWWKDRWRLHVTDSSSVGDFRFRGNDKPIESGGWRSPSTPFQAVYLSDLWSCNYRRRLFREKLPRFPQKESGKCDQFEAPLKPFPGGFYQTTVPKNPWCRG